MVPARVPHCSNIYVVVRDIATKAVIIFLAVLIAAILILPQVDLDPVAPRLEWAAWLLIIFLAWLAGMARVMAIQNDGQSLTRPVPETASFFRLGSGDAETSLLRC